MHMFGNLLSLDSLELYSQKILKTVLQGTNLLRCIIEFVTKNPKLDSDAAELVCWVSYASSYARDLSVENIDALKTISVLFIRS